MLIWGAGLAGVLVLLYVISAVVFATRGGEGLFKGLSYKLFVARRYLLNAHPKVTKRTKWLIAACLVGRLMCQVLFALGVGAATWENPLWDVERGIEGLLLAVLVSGVLVHSKPALYAFFVGVGLSAAGGALNGAVKYKLIYENATELPTWFTTTLLILLIGGAVLAGLAIFFGILRAFFTFFTTVPIGGVWIGTGALVIVLSVMSGFESDLREKILGSNAHIQITREDGDFTEWHQIKAKVDQIPGVVASTPYAVSEVVIAANNSGMNVIIKGIDPKTVGKVTELIKDLEGNESEQAATMQRLEPLVPDIHDLRVVPTKPASHVIDPPPADLPGAGDPIDFSKPGSDADPDPEPDSGSGSGSSGTVIDPPPPDVVVSDEPPIDFSRPDAGDAAIHVVDVPIDSPSLSRRTQALPGILVGRELVKQTHLFAGEEVRVVSPLSDPANPDATGTPIPFNRDYRVAGIFFTGMYEYDLKYVYVTLDSLDDFLDRGDAVDGIEVRVVDADDTGEYVDKLGAALGPQYRIQDWKELNHSLFSALKLEKTVMFIVLGIVILVASFSILGNLVMVVVEKGREIALLKTLGTSDAGIMQLFAIQGLLIGLIGTVIGVASGLATCYVLKRVGFPLNPDVYYIDRMPVNVDAISVGYVVLAGVVISIAATFYPALLAARVRPAVGMRH